MVRTGGRDATCLGALVALSEEPSLSPSTHKVAHNHLKLHTLFWPEGTADMVPRYICGQKHPHI